MTEDTKPTITDDELRQKCQEIAVDAIRPLREGDLGLADIEKLLPELQARKSDLYKRFEIPIRQEDAIVIPIAVDAIERLRERLYLTAPTSHVGAAAKLRRLLDPAAGLEYGVADDDFASLRQVLDFIERQAGGPLADYEPGGKPEATLTACMALRTLARYRACRELAERRGADVSALPDTPPYQEIEEAYIRLLEPTLDEPIRFTNDTIAPLEMMAMSIADQWSSDCFEEACIVGNDTDRAMQLRLIGGLFRFLNDRNNEEMLAAARRQRERESA